MKKNPKMHLGHFERIRRKILSGDIYLLSDDIILEMLLILVFRRADTNEIAREILAEFGDLQNLIKNGNEDNLSCIRGMGPTSAMKLACLLKIMEYVRKMPHAKAIPTAGLVNYSSTITHIEKQFEGLDHEIVIMFILNNLNEIVCTLKLQTGDKHHVIIDASEVARIAHANNAKKVVLAHNHVGKSSFMPSLEDVQFTASVINCLNAYAIPLLDHIIVAYNGKFSFANSQLLSAISRRLKTNPDWEWGVLKEVNL